MRRLLLALVLCLWLVSIAQAEVDFKAGAFLNWQDGEQLFTTAIAIKPLTYKKIGIDWWITDIDRMVSFQSEFTTGLDISYNFGHLSDYIELIKRIPIISIIDKYADFGIGYGMGVKKLFTHDCELKHGITTYGFTYKF